jgi:hypothetical protein
MDQMSIQHNVPEAGTQLRLKAVPQLVLTQPMKNVQVAFPAINLPNFELIKTKI